MNSLFKRLKKEHDIYAKERGVIITTSREILMLSKKAIFSIHRNNPKDAAKNLADAEQLLTKLQKNVSQDECLQYEGSYLAALEEYVEAKTLVEYLRTGHIPIISHVSIPYDAYLSGLADVTGELLRQMVLQTTTGKTDNLKRYYKTAQEITAALLEFDLTGKLRQKFDETKRNLKSMEQILYDVSLR